MTGWIISTRLPGQEPERGAILGFDGLIYGYRLSDQTDEFSGLELKTCVSFSVLSADEGDIANVIIEAVVSEDRDPELERIDGQLQALLSQKRYLHCFRVSKLMRALGERFGYSPLKAELTGLVHDTSKENTMEENQRIIREAGLRMAGFELREHSILHAAAGSTQITTLFGIEDPDIVGAVRYHNGRPAMKKLEKMIFLADHMDFVFKNGIGFCNEIITQSTLDRAIFKMFMIINKVTVQNGIPIDPITESTMNYMFVNLNGSEATGEIEADVRTPIPDELFDKLLEINARRGLPVRSVKNIRDLGGCGACDNRQVRRGMLVRSARLSEMTDKDAAWLAEYGIGTVIDLRCESEIAESPDRNTERFRVIHCPLPTVELTQYQKEIQEKYFLTPPGEEKAYYLSEYLSCIDMKEMYMSILTDENAIISLRRIFDLLCEPGRGGFLFHCTSGKDRTGIVAALILLALGVDEEEVRDDYYTSALATFSETEAFAQSLRRQHYSAAYIDEMRYYNGIGMSIAETIGQAITTRFGSAEKYLTDHLLSRDKIRMLRARFTEEMPAR